ncbi:segmentation protein cap'n'collar isoform X3 [Bacillus rossius redtenbacheri]|uniref:segmentation protein cap'n'collar isoform X3 n=1 Tax=Bacillus rossius redtenbacheri TaxID=93214 RepID=UPI002FDCC9D6
MSYRMKNSSPELSFSHLNKLTSSDMDLIEDLWKQDVDLGFSLDLFSVSKDKDGEELDCLEKLKAEPVHDDNPPSKNEDNLLSEDLDPWVGLPYTIDLETGEYVLQTDAGDELSAPSVDEPSCSSSQALAEEPPPSFAIPPSFSLEEALQLIGLDEESSQGSASDKEPPEADRCLPDEQGPEPEGAREGVVAAEPARDPDPDMIQTAQFHHPHPHPFQGRMPLVRTVSMEQRWQDLANLLSLPGPPPPPVEPGQVPHPFAHHHHHHHHHHHYAGGGGPYQPPADSGRGVLLPPPLADLNATSPYPSVGMGASSNLGSAVATSMNLTNSSEPIGDSNPPSAFKAEGSHDMMYYQNSTTEMNQTTDGFLSSILNDEDLQLMDMAMNEGMYTMRMLDGNNSSGAGATALQPHEERADASSDSAVSSMGSERVPSVSDGEWMETGSDSGHTAGDHYAVDYQSGKYRPYDYSYSGRQHSSPGVSLPEVTSRMPPMAQKKHQMYGKRYFQEQGSAGSTTLGSHGATPSLPAAPVKYEYGEAAAIPGNTFSASMEGAVGPKPPEIKYSCSVEFMRHHPEPRQSLDHVQHNHTYHLPPESMGALQRPVTRDKQRGRKSEEEHLNRDEKRARSMNIPITVSDIINLPMDEFNERLSKYDLSEAQLSLIRDIRRRGKNKVAAQNCRKRKLDQILSLADEVRDMKDRKNRLLMDRDFLLKERQLVKDKFSQLYRHIFQSLRDADGNPYSPYEYSLQQSADGTVLLVPRTNASLLMDTDTMHSHKDHEHHRKE